MTRDCIVLVRRHTSGLRAVAAAAFTFSAVLPATASATTYSVTVVESTGSGRGIAGNAINSSGHIAGQANFPPVGGVQHDDAMIFKNGVLTDLGDIPNSAATSVAIGINAGDQVVGYSFTGGAGHTRPVLWQNGTLTDLGIFTADATVQANSINTAGQIVGFAQGSTTVAWLYVNGTTTTLPNLSSSVASEAWGMNSTGQIVGASAVSATNTHAAMWQSGVVHDLGALSGGMFAEALSINSSGVAVGFSTLSETHNGITQDFGDRHAVKFQGGVLTDLAPDTPFLDDSHATGINTAGVIVGDKVGRAFIWVNGVGTDLNTLLAGSSGVVLSGATGINDNGQIVANGDIPGFPGTPVTVILTPQ
jgi:probable HAF family extracellular repeat protein